MLCDLKELVEQKAGLEGSGENMETMKQGDIYKKVEGDFASRQMSRGEM